MAGILGISVPLILHDLLDAVEHATVVVLAGDGYRALDLTVGCVNK